jgi:ABC transport system ATP-binding/permease protein
VPLITLDQLSLAFGHLPLFDKADLRIESGERIALIGRNGAGKSSLLKVLAGELPPDRGSIWRSPGLRVARLE